MNAIRLLLMMNLVELKYASTANVFLEDCTKFKPQHTDYNYEHFSLKTV